MDAKYLIFQESVLIFDNFKHFENHYLTGSKMLVVWKTLDHPTIRILHSILLLACNSIFLITISEYLKYPKATDE